MAGLLAREWGEMLGRSEQAVAASLGAPPTLEQLAIIRSVGEWHALRGEWNEALRCSRWCIKFNHADSLDHATQNYVNVALASIQAGDEDGYRLAREEMAARFKEPDERIVERILTVAAAKAIDSGTAAILERSIAVLKRHLDSGPATISYPIILSLIAYRRGECGEAIERLEETLPKVSNVPQLNAMSRLILAMFHHKSGNAPTARLELEQARNLIQTGFHLDFDMWHWRNWVLTRILLRECEAQVL